MTIDSGSSLSQSETHLEVFENVVEDDKTMLAYNINDKLMPFMLMHGFPWAAYALSGTMLPVSRLPSKGK